MRFSEPKLVRLVDRISYLLAGLESLAQRAKAAEIAKSATVCYRKHFIGCKV